MFQLRSGGAITLSEIQVGLSSAFALFENAIVKTLKGTEFGRNIKMHASEASKSGALLKISVGKTDNLVVIPEAKFLQMQQVLQGLEQVIDDIKMTQLEQSASEYDRYIASLRKPENAAAHEAIFSMSDDKLNATYKPGRTETD